MATGDFSGTRLSHQEDVGSYIGATPLQLGYQSEYFAVAYDVTIRTYHVDSGTGAITQVDSLNIAANNQDMSYLVHVAGNIYAFVHSTTGWQVEILTVSIDAAGNIGAAAIASDTFGGGLAKCHPLNVADGVIALYYWTGGDGGPTLKTFTIALDGSTITATDSWSEALILVQSPMDFARKGETNIFVGMRGEADYAPTVFSWEISNAGAITAKDNQALTATKGKDGTYDEHLVFCDGSDMWVSFHVDASNHVVISTFTVSDAGVISAVLDTDTDSLLTVFAHDAGYLYDGVIMVIYGTHSAKTFAVNTVTGTIGAEVDTEADLDEMDLKGWIIHEVGNTWFYTGVATDLDYHRGAISVETGSPAGPSGGGGPGPAAVSIALATASGSLDKG